MAQNLKYKIVYYEGSVKCLHNILTRSQWRVLCSTEKLEPNLRVTIDRFPLLIPQIVNKYRHIYLNWKVHYRAQNNLIMVNLLTVHLILV
jgi:hypothetical protein